MERNIENTFGEPDKKKVFCRKERERVSVIAMAEEQSWKPPKN